MKKVFTLLMLSFGTTVLAQSNEEKIREVYGSYAAELSPDQKSWLNNCLSRCHISLVETGATDLKNISEISTNNKFLPDLKAEKVFTSENFNPLRYNIDFFKKDEQKFRLYNTNYILTVAPMP